jgi:hypothetical protein
MKTPNQPRPSRTETPLTGHRRVESISNISNITLRKRPLMRINSKRKVLLPLVRVGIRRSGRSKQTEADRLPFDGVSVLAFTQKRASVAKVVGHFRDVRMGCITGWRRLTYDRRTYERRLRTWRSPKKCYGESHAARFRKRRRMLPCRCGYPPAVRLNTQGD